MATRPPSLSAPPPPLPSSSSSSSSPWKRSSPCLSPLHSLLYSLASLSTLAVVSRA